MRKYMKYIAPAAAVVGLAMLVFGIVCLGCAGNGIGRLEDTYYYLGLNLHHGRFDACDAGSVLDILDDIGITGSVISGFERFAIYARFPFFFVGLVLAAFGVVVTFRQGFTIPEKVMELVAFVWHKIQLGWSIASAWVRSVIRGRRCPVCGDKLMRNAAFCGNCGAKIETAPETGVCPDCGAKNEPGDNFCNTCGRKLDV